MINSIQQISYRSIQQTQQINSVPKPVYSKRELLNLNNQVFYKNQISFGRNEPKLIKEYLKNREKRLRDAGIDYALLNAQDIKHLEGIQKGIKVFENLTMQQIKFLAQSLSEIALQRGCNNMCSHCYAEAMPPSYQKSENKINKIDFEDFENLCNGFKELNKRLGFNILESYPEDYITLFHDSDSSMIFLQDKQGKTYDYLDLAKMLNDFADKLIIFDTAGWNLQDKKTQKRMEELVKKAINTDKYDFVTFNISANPFHSIYSKSVQQHLENNKEKEQKFREIYKNRMANVIFTLSPLIEKDNLHFIARALPNKLENVNGYKEDDLKKLYSEIIQKVKLLYEQDLESGNKKVIKTKEQINKYLQTLKSDFRDIDTDLSVTKRLSSIVTDSKTELCKNARRHYFNNPKFAAKIFKYGILDINGKFYTTNFYETYKTDIQLNYINKNKKTAPIAPELRKKQITQEMYKR